LLLLAPPDILAQWGAIQRGIDAARQGEREMSRPAPAPQDPNAPFNRARMGATFASPMTFQNRVRPFSYTIPTGWQKEGGNPTGERADFGRPGSTASFNFHFTRMVPSFPRKAAVDAGYKQAKEEMSIGKYLSVRRKNQGGRNGVIGWETIETARGSGGFQRIQWQCYDRNNYYYSFMTAVNPQQFHQYRSEMQRIIDSIRFER
ncbi:MAG TPA: hypothetical protein VE082_00945, partial [Desulfobaccales bacterium]|nr:hypothetical protein [Desulfobaccales bacterium]